MSLPSGWLMLEMSIEITVEWFSGDLLLFCNHLVGNAASSEEMSSMQTDAGSSVCLLGWRGCLPVLHAGTALSPRPPGPGILSQKNNRAKDYTSSCLKGKTSFLYDEPGRRRRRVP